MHGCLNNYKFLLLTIWLTVGVFGFTAILAGPYTTLELVMTISVLLTDNWYGLAFFIFILCVRPLTFLPISIFTVVGGVLFGPWLGIIVSYTGVILSSALAYLVGYWIIKEPNLLSRLYQKRLLIYNHPFEFLLGLHLSMLPFDIINYSAGISKIPFRPFLSAVTIGMVPGVISLTLLGASFDVTALLKTGINVDAFNWNYLAISLSLFVIANLSSYWWRRKRIKK